MRTLAGPGRAVRVLAYEPGPRPRLTAAGDDVCVRTWDLMTGDVVVELSVPRGLTTSLALAADGRLARGARTGRVTVWQPDRANLRRYQLLLPVVALGFTAGGRALLAATSGSERGVGGQLVFINLPPHDRIEAMDWSGDLETAAFCASRDLVAIASYNRGVEFLEVGRPRREPAFWMPGRVRAMAFSPGEGRYLAIAGGRTVGVWDVEAGAWRSQCAGHKGDVNAVAFSPDGLSLLAGGMDRSVRLFETLSGRQLMAWDWKIGVTTALAYAADGMTAAAAGDKARVVVWDVDEG